MALLTATIRFRAPLRVGLAVCLAAASALLAWAQPAGSGSDRQIKAVFLYNFTQFVEWPADAFSDPRAPLTIGVLGDDPFGALLDEAVRGEKANGRSLTIRRYRLVEEVGACHILFISRSETARLETILRALNGRSILTVGDTDNFANAGGIVQFVAERERIRLRINLGAARTARLAISSKLLRSVEVVNAEKK